MKTKTIKQKSLLDYYNFTKTEQKKYPVVTGILKQLTPERIEKEIKEVQNVKLPPELQKWVEEYEKVGGKRENYMWKWAYTGWETLTLSCVKKKYQKPVVLIKTCNTILNALIDDLADKRKEKDILINALDIFFDHQKTQNILTSVKKSDREYITLIEKIWNFIKVTTKKYPRYKEFENIFEYDYRQFLNTIRYSFLININPNLINLSEHNIYSAHNMQGTIGITIDLMCCSKFNIKEIGAFREIIWNAQQMGRIGNLITTWEKEIYENDFTSGIFAYVLNKNIIRIEDLRKNKKNQVIQKIKLLKAEKYFLKQWENYYNKIHKIENNVKSVNIKKILEWSQQFLIMHLTSRGLEI
jgi:hypothetical protein